MDFNPAKQLDDNQHRKAVYFPLLPLTTSPSLSTNAYFTVPAPSVMKDHVNK